MPLDQAVRSPFGGDQRQRRRRSVTLVGETSLAGIAHSARLRGDDSVGKQGAHRFHRGQSAGQGLRPAQVHRTSMTRRNGTKLKALPNLLYTDGNAFSLWRNGELIDKLVNLDGDVETSGAQARAPPASLLPLIAGLPELAADSAKRCEGTRRSPSARLCRLPARRSDRTAGGQQGARSSRPRTGGSTAVPRCEQCAVRRRLCAGGHVRPADGQVALV